jgi:hypothetical protein
MVVGGGAKAAGEARQDEESSKWVPTMDCAARHAKGLGRSAL